MYSTQQLRIDTPEQVALELPIAGIGSRFLAIAIDTVLQAALATVTIVVFALSGLGIGLVARFAASWQSFAPALAVLLLFCIYWGYFAVFEIAWRGQTPGKRLAKIRVIRDSGRPIDAAAAIIRNLLRAIDLLPAMYGVGLACMMLNRHSRRLGDFAAGTVVVHDRPGQGQSAPWSPTPAPGSAQGQAVRISDAELVLIETYLARRLDYDPPARDRAATEIARRIIKTTGLSPEPGQHVDDFLEAIAAQARDAARFR